LKKRLRLIILIILAAAFVVSAVMVIKDLLEYRKGAVVYSEAQDIAGISQLPELSSVSAAENQSPSAQGSSSSETGAAAGIGAAASDDISAPAEAEDPLLAALKSADLPALQLINDDVIGWILIPDTKISYPLVHCGDNSYYLNRNWKKEWSSVGSIFLDRQSSPDLSDFNSLIFGHRMKDGSMFAGLAKFFRQAYWEEHPCVYVVLDGRVLRYDIYAAYEAAESGPTYDTVFASSEAKESFIRYGIRYSAINTGIIPTAEDHIITLVTCTGRGYSSRLVVQAVLAEELQ